MSDQIIDAIKDEIAQCERAGNAERKKAAEAVLSAVEGKPKGREKAVKAPAENTSKA